MRAQSNKKDPRLSHRPELEALEALYCCCTAAVVEICTMAIRLFFYIPRNCGFIVLLAERCSTIGGKEIARETGIAIHHPPQQRHYYCAHSPTICNTNSKADHVLPPEQHPISCTFSL